MQDIDHQILSLWKLPNTKEQGFRMLMNTYQKDMYWHIKGIVKTHEDTDDVLQNTFVKVFRSLDRFKEESNLYTWMYRIATNEALTHLKKQQRTQTSGLEVVGEPMQYAGISDEGEEIVKLLQSAVEKLPEKQRMVFNMRYFQEMPYQQMADILETSVGALKASYHFAVKKIESELIQ